MKRFDFQVWYLGRWDEDVSILEIPTSPVHPVHPVHPPTSPMSDIALADLFSLVQRYPDLMLSQVIHFIGFKLACRLKNDIILTQPSTVPEMQPPDILPPSVKIFLQCSCGLSEDGVEMCWDLLKGMIWDGEGTTSSLGSDRTLDGLFRAHGNRLGLSSSQCSLPCLSI